MSLNHVTAPGDSNVKMDPDKFPNSDEHTVVISQRRQSRHSIKSPSKHPFKRARLQPSLEPPTSTVTCATMQSNCKSSSQSQPRRIQRRERLSEIEELRENEEINDGEEDEEASRGLEEATRTPESLVYNCTSSSHSTPEIPTPPSGTRAHANSNCRSNSPRPADLNDFSVNLVVNADETERTRALKELMKADQEDQRSQLKKRRLLDEIAADYSRLQEDKWRRREEEDRADDEDYNNRLSAVTKCWEAENASVKESLKEASSVYNVCLTLLFPPPSFFYHFLTRFGPDWQL